jgi:hypothetical protein
LWCVVIDYRHSHSKSQTSNSRPIPFNSFNIKQIQKNVVCLPIYSVLTIS